MNDERIVRKVYLWNESGSQWRKRCMRMTERSGLQVIMMNKIVFLAWLWAAVLLKPTLSVLMSVTFDGSNYYTHEKIMKNWVAKGSFHDNTFKDGLTRLTSACSVT
ncbi:hypothetical protein E2C01_013040 [Portunus trituberculatus]|uniref:Uncharacterized protein n=1 Tax=Portunus trituberculatus TaxID=210409 RepID=A0A5B7DG12_PORTR|nr:hypothetical protein [Portunus trituberculatus]